MGFESLLGNRQLKANLTASLQKQHISHFYLISGPAGSGKHTLAKLLAAAILCKDEAQPCLRCHSCRKLLEGSHPDFIIVEDPEHKTVPVRIVREYRDDAFILPNESDYKIYLFPQELGIEGQNALLKILEEPPAYGVFILLTDNPEKILPTVRSRCTELKLQALPADILKKQLLRDFPNADSDAIEAAIVRSGGFLGQARELLESGAQIPPQTESFVAAFSEKNSLLLTQTLVPMEKWKRDALAPIFVSWQELLEEALACRSGVKAVSPLARQLASRRSSGELYQAAQAIKKAADYTMSNVSPAAVCGWLAWELR